MRMITCCTAILVHLQTTWALYQHLRKEDNLFQQIYALIFFFLGIWLLKQAIEVKAR
jgi:hypothetical protein